MLVNLFVFLPHDSLVPRFHLGMLILEALPPILLEAEPLGVRSQAGAWERGVRGVS